MYYLDSSENTSPDPDAALAVFGSDLAAAQAAAVEAAKKAPGTEFYVNEAVTTYRVVYRATADVTVSTEVVNDPSAEG